MRAYLLLRDNCKTGPYSFQELLLMELTSLDLIWVEGYSQRWNHTTELDEFSMCSIARPGGGGQDHLKNPEALPGIHFRLPVHDIQVNPWGPVPTLALQGLDLFMTTPPRQRPVFVSTDEGDNGLSLFTLLPLADSSVRASMPSGQPDPLHAEQALSSNKSLRERQVKAPGKGVRRSRKKYPHHLDLSDVLGNRGRSAPGVFPAGLVEEGFHIEFD
jgi:hypothetical protein